LKARRLIGIFLLLLGSFHYTSAQIVEKNATSLELYYGFPDWWQSLLRYGLSSNIYSITMNSSGPFGGRFEHNVTKRVGIGMDIWYVKTSFSGIYTTTPSNTTSSNVYFHGNLARVNFLPRVTVHLAEHDKLDPYVHFGLGYLYSKLYFQSTNKSVYDESNPLPAVTFRFGMGVKYYFTPDFGGFVDVGLGGALVSFGLFKRWREK